MSRESRNLVWALRFLALLLVGLSLAAPLFREANAWGVWPATYLSVGWLWLLAALVVALVFLGDRVPWRRLSPELGAPWVRLIVALLAVIPFYLFRLRHLRWGDAYILIHAIPHPEARLTYTWQAPLDLFIHAKAWALGNRWFGWPDPTPIYWLISAVAGVVFIWVLWGLADWLGRDRVERGLLFGLIATLGLIQLFFGYIENYTIMTVGVLIYIGLALRAVRGELALLWPAAALAVTHAFHPSTIILTPSLLYLAWQLWRRPVRPASATRLVAQIALPYLLVLAGVFAFMTVGGHGLSALLSTDAPGGGDRRWFVPLFQTSTRWEHYTLFSSGHLVDIVNEQLLVAPAIWPGLLLAGIFAWRRLPWRDPAFRLLGVMAVCYLLLTLTWNADYGGQRDWDLFAPAALPAAVLCGYALSRALPERGALRTAGWALIATQFFHTALWIYQNTLPWTPTG